MRTLALLYSRDDPVADVGSFAQRSFADDLNLLRRTVGALHERKSQRLH